MSGPTAAGAGRLPTGFAGRLIEWQRREGRHDLPWQGTRDPYRVWLSEVMLQQTQVSSVLAYYPRFLARFPDVQALAAAHEDEVMALWSGLGYYSRARNLHRCAQVVVSEHAGVFPASALALELLPGIGASTAAAIAAFCHGERISILDGNVRRVLTRLLAFEGDQAQPAQQRALWQLAQALLPNAPEADDMAAYTQGLMDLGATLCTRSRPHCDRCPVQALCEAHRMGRATDFPIKTRMLTRRHETWVLVILRTLAGGQTRLWLQRRPARGIWAGLYCTPVYESESQAQALWPDARWQTLATVSHSLTHRELRLIPLLADLPPDAQPGDGQWMDMEGLDAIGIPAPVRSLLLALPGRD